MQPSAADPQTRQPQTQGFTFFARVLDGMDAGRDVCRLHPEAMSLLGVRAWDPVMLQHGDAVVGALAGFLDWNVDRRLCVIDSLTAMNLGLVSDDPVAVVPIAPIPAESVWLERPQGPALPMDAIRTALLGKAVVAGERESLLPQDYNRPFTHESAAGLSTLRQLLGPGLRSVQARITRTEPSGVVLVAANTRLVWEDGGAIGPLPSRGPDTTLTIADIGGLAPQAAQLREILELAFHHADLLARLGTDAPHGVLLQGPHGSGKAELAYAVAREVGIDVRRIPGIDLEYRAADPQAQAIRSAFEIKGPTVVLIQDVERLAPASRDKQGPAASVLYDRLDKFRDSKDVIAVATTTTPEDCDPALFEPGRIDRRIDIPMPDRAARQEILQVHTRGLPVRPDVDLQAIAGRTPGFVGADIAKLCHEAALNAAARLKDANVADPATIQVTADDFDLALKIVRPTSLGTAPIETGDLTFADVGDAEQLKQALTETVLWPLRYPDTFARLNLEPPRGILLFGPPGCGKTFLVRALANESAANLIAVKGAELLSKWVGESESGVRDLFRRARACAPSIVFLDEIDALAPQRGASMDSGVTDRVVAQLLTEMDGIESLQGVAVIGATNRPDLLDTALLRPGRLERHVFVDPPDAAARSEILKAICSKMPIAPDVDVAATAAAADGYSAADLEAVAREAGYTAMRRDPGASTITSGDFESARSRVRPSVDASVVERLRTFAGQEGLSVK